MLQIIRKGDKTTHGGSVLTASETMKFGGIGVARKGDKVSCPVNVFPRSLFSGKPSHISVNSLPAFIFSVIDMFIFNIPS